ncbi:MAG: hypothetical protein JSV01_00910 [Desulfobacterales bacterium]|nr:MAG: hypothetical protein JSV01_00910 [Desulfobacterales bacterium]
MNKIVILMSRPQPDSALMAVLDTVFPDCVVRVVFSATEALEEATTGPYALSKKGRKNSKDSSCK